MKESVSCIFRFENKIFFIKRKNSLNVFPGYHAPPGGKVDQTDSEASLTWPVLPKEVSAKVWQALLREMREEVLFDIEKNRELVKDVSYLGFAITPAFNPYRFYNHYFVVDLKEQIAFDLDEHEASFGEWKTPEEFMSDYEAGKILIVPAAMQLMKSLIEKEKGIKDFTTSCNLEEEIPRIMPIHGVNQFIPLSNTFPPANRTNSFLIGDEKGILIDPSPRDEEEKRKFLNTLKNYKVDAIMISHHHADHWEFSRDFAKALNVEIYISEDSYQRIGKDYFQDVKVNFLTEGMILTNWKNHPVRVYHVPGHDEGQMALAPDSQDWFFVGDLIQTVGTVVIGAPEGNMKKYFESLKRVIGLNPQFLLPSHGIIIGGTEKLSETLRHREIRENQIIELMKKNKTEDEMLEIVYVGLKTELLPYARKTIRAHVEKILEENLA